MSLKQKQEYDAYIARLKNKGVKLVAYPCPACREKIETLVPPKGRKHDSLVQCPHCEEMHFKVVGAGGRVEVRLVYVERARRLGGTHAARAQLRGAS